MTRMRACVLFSLVGVCAVLPFASSFGQEAPPPGSSALGVLEARDASFTVKVPKEPLWRPPHDGFVSIDTIRVLHDRGQAFSFATSDPGKGQCRVRLDGCIRFSSEDIGRRVTISYQYRPRRIAFLPGIAGTDYQDALPTMREVLVEELSARGFVMASPDDTADAIARLRQSSASDPQLASEWVAALAHALDVAYVLLPGVDATESSVLAGFQTHAWVDADGDSVHGSTTPVNRSVMEVAVGVTVFDGATGNNLDQRTAAGSKRVRFHRPGPTRRSLIRELTTRVVAQWRDGGS
jgi:hypothetical protein